MNEKKLQKSKSYVALQVHGVRGLRVVDASIMPKVTSGKK